MSKFKEVAKNLIRVLVSISLVVFLLIAPFTIMPNLLVSQSNINRTESYDYQGILELWHIETFEGGSKSRTSLLEKQAIAFEKINKGTYIVISTMTLEQFNLNISNGKKPNMISFGIGVGDQIVDSLCEIDTTNSVREDLLEGGKFNNKQLALPYILGGYALIANRTENFGVVGVGTKGTTNPVKCLKTNGITTNIDNKTEIDSYTAYDKYIKGNYDSLLGTQRDVYRVWNRQQKGLMTDVTFTCLGGYTDLVQYISVFDGNKTEVEICKKFANILTSQAVQNSLVDYNLYSVIEGINLYSTDVFEQMEKVLSEQLKVENVFLSIETINNKKNSEV